MVEERTCDYTGESIEPGTGIMYVAVDGSVLHFVDSKAEKNFMMGREARDLPWTEAGRPDDAQQSEPDESAAEPETADQEEAEEPSSDEDTAEDADESEASDEEDEADSAEAEA